jgi:hypothetical protein
LESDGVKHLPVLCFIRFTFWRILPINFPWNGLYVLNEGGKGKKIEKESLWSKNCFFNPVNPADQSFFLSFRFWLQPFISLLSICLYLSFLCIPFFLNISVSLVYFLFHLTLCLSTFILFLTPLPRSDTHNTNFQFPPRGIFRCFPLSHKRMYQSMNPTVLCVCVSAQKLKSTIERKRWIIMGESPDQQIDCQSNDAWCLYWFFCFKVIHRV